MRFAGEVSDASDALVRCPASAARPRTPSWKALGVHSIAVDTERSSTTLDLYTRRTDNGDRILQALTDSEDEGPEDGTALNPT
jgi:hypothetical protein